MVIGSTAGVLYLERKRERSFPLDDTPLWLLGADILALSLWVIASAPNRLSLTVVLFAALGAVASFRLGPRGVALAFAALGVARVGQEIARVSIGVPPSDLSRVASELLVTAVLMVFFAAISAGYRRTEHELRDSAERLRRVFDDAPIGMGVVGLDDRPISVNAAFQTLMGYSEEELRAKTTRELTHPEDLERSQQVKEDARAGELPSYGIEKRYVNKRGDTVWAKLTSTFIRDRRGDPLYRLAMVEDITQRKEAERRLLHLALHDSLTDLPNRTLLFDRLEVAIATARRNHGSVALVLLDLDDFKEVNDTFGHQVGDLLLQHVATRLSQRVRASDSVARLGGDEFAILLTDADQDGAVGIVDELLRALELPFVVEEQPVALSTSIGVTVFPQHGDDAATLLRRADVALYLAKRSRSGYAIYSPEQDRHSPARLALSAELRHAAERNELVLHYQPKVHLATGIPSGVEALIRWQHPSRGLLMPAEFVPIALRTGLVHPLTRWVMSEALEECRALRDAGRRVGIAVNVSVRNLLDPTLVATVEEMLDRCGLAPADLTLEITESDLMSDPDRVMATLAKLRQIGVHVAIDDLGTGYSSLAYLQRLPVDEVKIDKSFVMSMTSDQGSAAIVRATIDLGHSLGLKVVAEGVEDQHALDMLVALGSDSAQGFHLSPPLPVADLGVWLDHNLPLVADPRD